MNLVDSSVWLSFFADEPNAELFVPPLSDIERLVVPTMVLFEVFKVLLRESGENSALKAYGAMSKGVTVNLTSQIAMLAGKLSLQHHLPAADSIILSTARTYECVLWTQDAHFNSISGVRYFPKMR
jgi:predicted nucleic acid-binding protein